MLFSAIIAAIRHRSWSQKCVASQSGGRNRLIGRILMGVKTTTAALLGKRSAAVWPLSIAGNLSGLHRYRVFAHQIRQTSRQALLARRIDRRLRGTHRTTVVAALT